MKQEKYVFTIGEEILEGMDKVSISLKMSKAMKNDTRKEFKQIAKIHAQAKQY